MDNFFQIVSQFTNLSSDSKLAISACLTRLELPKGEVLIPENATGNFLYFVKSGLIRTFYFKEGKDVTDWFSPENSFGCSIVSFITRQPDRRSVEVLEPSVLFSLHFNDMEKLCKKHHDIETFFRRLVNLSLIQTIQKIDTLHFSTAVQRYQTFTAMHPSIIKRAPLGTVASYLGMTQETLSRIRSKM